MIKHFVMLNFIEIKGLINSEESFFKSKCIYYRKNNKEHAINKKFSSFTFLNVFKKNELFTSSYKYQEKYNDKFIIQNKPHIIKLENNSVEHIWVTPNRLEVNSYEEYLLDTAI